MNSLSIVLLSALAVVMIIATVVVRKLLMKRIANKLRAEMLAGLRENRDTFFRLTANNGRITGRIVNHQVEWVGPTDAKGVSYNTQSSISQLFQFEDLDPAEVEELEDMEAYLADVRKFRDHERAVVPQGFVTHAYPEISVNQYAVGTIKVGTRNKMRVVIERNADNTMYISQVQMSLNFTQFKGSIYDWKDQQYKDSFDVTYRDDNARFDLYGEELSVLNRIELDIKKFNDNVERFEFENGIIVGFRPKLVSKSQAKTEDQKQQEIDAENAALPLVRIK